MSSKVVSTTDETDASVDDGNWLTLASGRDRLRHQVRFIFSVTCHFPWNERRLQRFVFLPTTETKPHRHVNALVDHFDGLDALLLHRLGRLLRDCVDRPAPLTQRHANLPSQVHLLGAHPQLALQRLDKAKAWLSGERGLAGGCEEIIDEGAADFRAVQQVQTVYVSSAIIRRRRRRSVVEALDGGGRASGWWTGAVKQRRRIEWIGCQDAGRWAVSR